MTSHNDAAGAPLSGKQETLTGKQEPLTGKQEPLAGKQEPLSGKQEPLAGKNETMGGIYESLAGKNESLALSGGNLTTNHDSLGMEPTDEKLDDLRIVGFDPLISPLLLHAEYPLSHKAAETVRSGRRACDRIVAREDDRLLIVIGPCSIHDPAAAMDYARRLLPMALEFKDDLCIVMRTYFEKPRTTVGWKGLINDPTLDGQFQINRGLRIARDLLLRVNELGLPAATELLDTISPQFLGDVISWAAIGARTTESQLHRELTSGVSFPIGFKNGTGGSVTLAVDAMRATAAPHVFLGVNKHGMASIMKTRGNDMTHIILRGGSRGPNYEASHVQAAEAQMVAAGLDARIMIDCSHGNSLKKHKNQMLVASDVAKQVAAGCRSIIGLMIESNIEEGNQKLVPGAPLKYGVSITDACVDLADSRAMLLELAAAVRSRRAAA